MKSYAVERARHVVVRATDGDVVPDDLARVLGDQGVRCGWVRASGVLVDVELRAFDGPGTPRRIAGPVHALSLDGSVGLEHGEPSVGLRGVLVRETDRGMETLAGEILSARVVALEAFVTVFEDLAIGRALDAKANVVLFGGPGEAGSPADAERSAAPTSLARAVPAPAPSSPGGGTVAAGGSPASPAAWSDAIAASADPDLSRHAASRGAVGGAIPRAPSGPSSPKRSRLPPRRGTS